MIRNIFFDLDGTLLSLDVKAFMAQYTSGLRRAAHEAGFDGDRIVHAIMAGMREMIDNDGSATNEEAFWQAFSAFSGVEREAIERVFLRFYDESFDDASATGAPFQGMPETIRALKARGFRLFVTTNPLFPRVAIEHRLRWAGQNIADFEALTSYETSCFCKPNPRYYREVLDRFGLDPAETLMVGNDADEDGVIVTLGAQCILTKEELINLTSRELPCPLMTHDETRASLAALPDPA